MCKKLSHIKVMTVFWGQFDYILSASSGFFFPHEDRINRSQMSKVVSEKASCWDCQDIYVGKTKRRLHDRKTEHFKAISSSCRVSRSAIANHVTSTGHNFDLLARGRSDTVAGGFAPKGVCIHVDSNSDQVLQ